MPGFETLKLLIRNCDRSKNIARAAFRTYNANCSALLILYLCSTIASPYKIKKCPAQFLSKKLGLPQDPAASETSTANWSVLLINLLQKLPFKSDPEPRPFPGGLQFFFARAILEQTNAYDGCNAIGF